jgi:hypothetical protein
MKMRRLPSTMWARLTEITLASVAACGCGATGTIVNGNDHNTGGSAGNSAMGGSDNGTGGATTTQVVQDTGGAGGGGNATGGAKPTGGGGNATGGAKPTGGMQGTGGAPIITCNSNLTATGCTPGQLTATGTLNGRYGTYTATIGNKQYFLQVNEWGSSATQALNYGGSYFFKMTQQQAALPNSGAPAGYPSMFIGANSGHTTSGSGLPKAVSSLGTVPVNWTWDDNGALSDSSIFNAAYDVWFSTNSGGEPSASGPSGGYLMVWYHAQNCQPVGSLTDAGHLVDGLPGCWDVWTGTNSGKPVISYKHQGPIKSFGFDLNLFIKDALAHYPNYMKSSWYLTNIFTGFEIWSGGAALQSTSFCAEVN